MIRLKSLCLFFAFSGLVVACSESDPSAAARAAAAAEAVEGEGTCNTPPPPSSTPPVGPGCAENLGSGWVSVPCGCQLWVANTAPASIATRIEITVVPVPPEDGVGPADGHGAEITFDDADASWYGAWKTQSANGSFSVTNGSGKTTIHVGDGITLAPVPLSGCTTRIAQTEVTNANVSMRAVRDDGTALATMPPCTPPRPH